MRCCLTLSFLGNAGSSRLGKTNLWRFLPRTYWLLSGRFPKDNDIFSRHSSDLFPKKLRDFSPQFTTLVKSSKYNEMFRDFSPKCHDARQNHFQHIVSVFRGFPIHPMTYFPITVRPLPRIYRSCQLRVPNIGTSVSRTLEP